MAKIGSVLSGAEFNKLYADQAPFYKLTNEKEVHNGYAYADGLNVLNGVFRPKGTCSKGGLYFISQNKWKKWVIYGSKRMYWKRLITIPDEAQVYIEKGKFKTDQMVLGVRRPIRKTEDVYVAVASRCGGNLSKIPKEGRTKKVCLAAVTQDGYALAYVPTKLMDNDICVAAVTRNGLAFEYVPNELRGQGVWLAAVTYMGSFLELVPDEQKTREICRVAVAQSSYALRFVPDELKTHELCLAAVTRNGDALQYVPKELKDHEICLAAEK